MWPAALQPVRDIGSRTANRPKRPQAVISDPRKRSFNVALTVTPKGRQCNSSWQIKPISIFLCGAQKYGTLHLR